MNKRPLALSGMALVLGATGAMLLLVALGAIQVMEPGQGGGWMAIVFGGLGVLCVALAYGLFALKSWAWPLGIATAAVIGVVALLSVINRGTLAFVVLMLAPTILLLGALFLPDVRKALGHDSSK